MNYFMYSTTAPHELHRMVMLAIHQEKPNPLKIATVPIVYIDVGNADRVARALSLTVPNGEVRLAENVKLRAIYANGNRVATHSVDGWDAMSKQDRLDAGIPCRDTGKLF